jgi:predicted membrane channel-forming protein YqfA (hemolysin III family)
VDPELLPEFKLQLFLIGGVVYIVGAVIYAAAIPERCYKRTFDIFGASH